MARRRKKKLPREAIECQIVSLSHEGRGIAKLDGKTQFVEGALPGETVLAKYIEQRAKFDELSVREVISSVAERVKPPCVHAENCGGCSLQHMATQAQIDFKQGVLKEQFRHFGDIEPEEWQSPLTGPNLGYRGKARLGVRYVPKRQEVLVGFREKRSNFIADLSSCAVLDPRIGEHFEALKMLVTSLSNVQALPQFEVAMGDHKGALILRHMEPLTNGDLEILRSFGKEHDLDIYLQPKGPDTAHKIWPEGSEERLHYCLSIPSETGSLRNSVELAFHPLDFTQVNSDINRKMVAQAMEWLDVKENERVLDLFCGLGNFTIPLATQAQEVVGVEGVESMVSRGQENAKRNGLGNVTFYAADLQADFTRAAWASGGFDKILIDPPRSGALDVVKYLSAFKAEKIVYVSCNPATLARDAGILIEHGYRLTKAGVMDMFPHTSHVESMALFEKS